MKAANQQTNGTNLRGKNINKNKILVQQIEVSVTHDLVHQVVAQHQQSVREDHVSNATSVWRQDWGY